MLTGVVIAKTRTMFGLFCLQIHSYKFLGATSEYPATNLHILSTL